MFSNLIGQESIADMLRCEVNNDMITNSMIFHGNKYTGKLTAAFELVRVLNCDGDKSKNCKCSNCLRVNSLDFNGMILLSRRNYYYETVELIKNYKQKKSAMLRNQIYKNLKLSYMPLENFLIDGAMSENDKKSAFKYADKVSEIIDNKEYNSVELEIIEETMKSFYDLYRTPNIPVNQIRNMLNWTYLSLDVKARVVIIDKVDYLESSSENILLKRLEEPSSNLYFILLAENKNRIIQTIKSRCRSYYFSDLSKESIQYIISKKYEDDNTDFKNLLSYFHNTDPCSADNSKVKLTKLINLTFNKNHSFSELYLFLESEKDKNQLIALIQGLKNCIDKEFLCREYSSGEGENLEFPILSIIDYNHLTYITDLLNTMLQRITIYNLSPKNQLEGFLYPIKEMVLNDKI
ncbi:MAG: hypothetical protein A2015_09045 [Spirochaetes bacterium GWF1_31_7]|nr:MAG: hypothetical protein A2Y30_09175 [Spirochaetes bacterium GWE1_32_154]OHD46620.1 MAG: hypothetical protein A2Y29_07680 [Spirochaetes bacterium GWE2_31_10]OHD47634.1 MAG: hypothetical protein A2015_09045 [Spirochaetes bacterium GWF1_31_7]OHD75415.1 MAG: hypothetical protein A2355_18500 [Spirochaetes bacterium RIFOXYB1_FULL_32_8]HBD94412.1 hypothetical protein [Spirochaetia bacterium]